MAVVAWPYQESAVLPSINGTCTTANSQNLVFQLEADDFKQSNVTSCNAAHIQRVRERIGLFSSPGSPFASRLRRDVVAFQNTHMVDGEDAMLALANQLCSAGYSVSVRNAIGGGDACFRNLRHEFLMVRGTDDFEGVEYIVDLHFKEQFEIPHPTLVYADILASVPTAFVGPISRLMPVVQALCTEMAASFLAQGLTLPPWRKTQSMLSKWLPAKVRDLDFSSPKKSCTHSASHAEFASSSIEELSSRLLRGGSGPAAPLSGDHSHTRDEVRTQVYVKPLLVRSASHTIKIGFAV